MKQFILIISSLLLTSIATAHGEDKPGPHGGFIKMPGAFHTEVKLEDGVIKIWLLDISFKNPLIEKSSVEVTTLSSGKSKPLACERKTDYFSCNLSKELKKGDHIVVKAVRNEAKGNEAHYEWPLSHAQSASESHSQH